MNTEACIQIEDAGEDWTKFYLLSHGWTRDGSLRYRCWTKLGIHYYTLGEALRSQQMRNGIFI